MTKLNYFINILVKVNLHVINLSIILHHHVKRKAMAHIYTPKKRKWSFHASISPIRLSLTHFPLKERRKSPQRDGKRGAVEHVVESSL